MTNQDDYTALDKPELVRFVFYPRQWHTNPPKNATDYVVPVGSDVSITCRFYVKDAELPNILYFHGNGEVVADHDSLAPLYNERGINLFVADYRGYGASTGSPNFSSMVEDAHPIFDAFLGVLSDGGFTGRVFVMGRSLGSVSAIELASTYPDQISGLIIESGLASTVRLMTRLGFSQEYSGHQGSRLPQPDQDPHHHHADPHHPRRTRQPHPLRRGPGPLRQRGGAEQAHPGHPRWRSQHAADGGDGGVLQGHRGVGLGGVASLAA